MDKFKILNGITREITEITKAELEAQIDEWVDNVEQYFKELREAQKKLDECTEDATLIY